MAGAATFGSARLSSRTITGCSSPVSRHDPRGRTSSRSATCRTWTILQMHRNGAALAETAVIKLNGRPRYVDGCHRPQVTAVKDGLSFLDIIARQILRARRKYDAARRADELVPHQGEILQIRASTTVSRSTGAAAGLYENMEPKPLAEDRRVERHRAWRPPGRDLFTASGCPAPSTLAGSRFPARVHSNSDNLGAALTCGSPPASRVSSYPSMEVAGPDQADHKAATSAPRNTERELVLRELRSLRTRDQEFQHVRDSAPSTPTTCGWTSNLSGAPRGRRRHPRAADHREPQDGRPADRPRHR